MASERQEILEILQHNAGFEDPALWTAYARSRGFRRVKASKITRCPDCGTEDHRRCGQYVYYSSLIHLLECAHCGLIWADTHIDPSVLKGHFEAAYKDDVYFRERRRRIFEHLSAVIDQLAPPGAKVLDIGGARGDLMHAAVVRRPDLRVTVNDLSTSATTWAATHFGFATVCGDAGALAHHSAHYDVAVLSDVLYYEPDLATLWLALSRLIRPGGAIVIRVPNHYLLTRLGQRWDALVLSKKQRLVQDRVRCFNPEHIFILRERYLRARLQRIGFASVQSMPSPLLTTPALGYAQSAYFHLARFANTISRGSVVLTPSMLIVGTRKASIDE